MVSIDPRPGALRDVGSALNSALPVVMVNLLRFKEQAGYADSSSCTGLDAYKTYSQHAFPLVHERGGSVVYFGEARGMIIAPDEEQWDEVLLIRYPNFDAFVTMIKSDEYQKIVHHRTAALSDSRLFATQEK